jgi:hypothetical protein
MMNNQANWLIVLLFAGCVFVSCDELKDGCLDTESVNLDVTADRPCDDCCKSPQLVCTVLQEYGGEVFFENRPVLNIDNDWFRIKSVAFYLSDFQLFRGMEALNVEDTLTMRTFGSGVGDTTAALFRNDFELVRRTALNYSVGRFKPSGTFDAISCRVGLSPEANRVVPRYAPSGHPLAKQPDSLWLNRTDAYVFMQIILAKDTLAGTLPDTIRLTANDLASVMPISTMGTFTHDRGFDFKVNLTVDYGFLLGNLNLNQPSTWKSQIATNIKQSFTFSQ